MDINEIRKLNWVSIENWNGVLQSYKAGKSYFQTEYFVTEKDIDDFIEIIIRDTARKFNMSYSELFKIVKEENHPFYNAKLRLYSWNTGLSKNGATLRTLENMFRIPVLEESSSQKVERFIRDFSNLSDEEKVEVLERISM